MFDFQKTLTLIKGGLLSPRATWESYLAEDHSWRETAALLTGPLIVGATLLGAIFSWLFRRHYMFGPGDGGVLGLIGGIIVAALGVAIISFIFSYLAGVFKGEHNFARGLAAVSLAGIPGYIGNVIGTLPWIGWLLSLGLAVVTLVFLYQITPLYLKVPDEKRVLHYVVALIASIVVVFIIGAMVGYGALSSHRSAMMGDTGSSSGKQYGMFGGIERRAELMEEAENDRFEAPEDGRISDAQMTRYMDIMRKTAELRREDMERLEQIGEATQGEEMPDLSKMASGFSTLFGAATAEMEVVKTGGGNWAEHQWIKEQLRIARIQKDISDAVKYNYAVYDKHADELARYDAMP